MPYPCRSIEPHGQHPHTAVFDTVTPDLARTEMHRVIVERGMWCAGYVPGNPDEPVMEWRRVADEYGLPIWRWTPRDDPEESEPAKVHATPF